MHTRQPFQLNAWLAQQFMCNTLARPGSMSESDSEAPWTIGPDAEGSRASAPHTGGQAGPPPPQHVDTWREISQIFSSAILQVLDTRYATPFTGSILTYLPQELLRPYHNLTRLVVSIRPMRPHEYNHPLILEAEEMEENTGTTTVPTDAGGSTMVSGPRPPDTPPPAHLLGSGTEAMTSPSPAETALATAIADVTNEGRASSKAAPKPRATGSRKPLCLISFWLSVWFRPHCLLANAGVHFPGTTGDRVCSSNSEGSCFISSAEHALGRHALADLGRHPEWAQAFDVRFGHRAAATTSHQCRPSRKTGPMCHSCSTAWYSIVLFYSLVMIGRYGITTIRRSTRVRDLQCHCPIYMLYVWELVNALAGLLANVRFSQNPEGSPSATYYVASSDSVSTTTTVITGSTTSSRVRDSSTGPKSGHIHKTLKGSTLLRLLILLTQVSILKAVNVDVRVGGPAAVPPGASSEAKHSSTREASVPIFERTDPSRIAKRTYHRAYARAARQGGSFYQGRWRDFSWYQKAHIKPIYVPRTRQSPKLDGHYIRVCTWNAGGLTRPTFQEIETWVRDQAIDVMFIQETKWAEEYCWDNKDYTYIHSAGTQKVDKVGGVLTMISSKLAKSSDVQFQSIWAGRILHVRVPAKGSSIDLVNVYQYSANEKPETLHRRQAFLQRLHKCLAGLPRRHSLIVSGDMNTSSVPTEHVCGSQVLPVGEYHKQDYTDFLHLCEALALTLLNTWTKPAKGQLETFRFGSLSSQIDYVMVRKSQATPIAKQAKALAEFPVAGWREGAKHYPVLALVPVQKPRWHAAQSSSFQRLNLAAVLEDLRQARPPPRLQAFQQEVDHKIKSSEDFDQTVLQAALQHYPPPARPATPPTQPAELANSARHMWQLFRQMRSHKFTMHGVVQAWKLWVRFSRAHAIHKSRANARVKARRDDLLQKAQQAADTGNMYEIWGVVKQLAPRTRHKKAQLHKHGVIMAPEAELAWIAQAFGERFGEPFSAKPTALLRQHPPVQLEVQDVNQALRHIPARKAVPPGAIPAAFWKACADQIAAPLTSKINHAWSQPQVEVQQSWANADVALLPKGKKQVKTPLDLRPIGLQHPIGKTLMKVLTSRAKEQIASLVKQWPQAAYVPGRSTATALKIVFSHCHAVRTACAQARLSLHQKHAGQATQHRAPQLRGGLQVSLDLTAAFDLVNWSHLRTALALAQIEPSTQELLLQWLRQVVYVFHHKGGRTEVRPAWGLRQGCPASPFLWAVFTALLNQAFDQRLHSGWAAEHVVMYADDSHLRWTFDTYAGFERAITELRLILRIFAQFDMKINFQKTQALLLTTGTAKSKILKHYIRHHSEGRRLLLSPSDPTNWIPLVTQAEYLGLIISYERFEALSTRHRISKAHQRRWALASILHSRKLAKPYKLHIWRSCVQTTMLYGLHCLGLSQQLMHELQVASMKHIRTIVSDQQHLTGHTHQEIMRKFNIDSMMTQLQKAHARELQLQKHHDWMQQYKWNQHITRSFASLSEPTVPDESDKEQDTWACPLCDSFFSTAAALKIHAQRTHGRRDEPQQIFDRTKHSLGGLPACKFCLKKFARWQTLAHHINYMACPVFEDNSLTPDLPTASSTETPLDAVTTVPENQTICLPDAEVHDALPLVQQPPVQHIARKGLKHFIAHKQMGSYLRQHCAICGQWTATNKVMKLHYRNTHPDIFPKLQKSIGSVIERCATPSIRCHFCDGKHQDWRAHIYKCTTIWQCAVLCVLQDPEHGWICGARPGNGTVLRDGREAQGVQHAGRPGGHAPEASQGGCDSSVELARVGPGRVGASRPLPKSATELQLKQGSIASFCSPPGLAARRGAEAVAAGHNHGPVVQPGVELGLPHLYHTAVAFKKRQQEEPTWGLAHVPLKQVMATALFRELRERHHKVLNTPELLKTAVDMGWKDNQGWVFQTWNPQLRHLERDNTRPPIPDTEMSNKLEFFITHLKRDVVHRFHCTRKLTETMDSKATFHLDLSVRNKHAEEIWDQLVALQGCCVFQLIGLGYRRERLGKGPAAQKVLDMLKSL